MHLGIVMMGLGAHAAACAGVMEALEARKIVPCAVCGMQAGAWPAAVFLAGRTGYTQALEQAARVGKKLLLPDEQTRSLFFKGRPALCTGRRIEHLLNLQTGRKMLGMCERQGFFLCRMARGNQRVVFSTAQRLEDEGEIVTMQASVGYAARAAMAMPPFLSPMDWLGTPLLPIQDVELACSGLKRMGAHRVLVIAPEPSSRRCLDALELMDMAKSANDNQNIGILRIPVTKNALDLNSLTACAQEGRNAAEQGLDRVLEQMGMAFCRVLPFRKTITWCQR